jgi:hypothetical protein
MVAERKAKLKKKGAPMWRPTTDIQKKWRGPIAVSTSIAAAIAVCVYFVATGQSGAALINHPLSAAHSSKAFAAQAPAGRGATVAGGPRVACRTAAATRPLRRLPQGFKARRRTARTGRPPARPAGIVRGLPASTAGCARLTRVGRSGIPVTQTPRRGWRSRTPTRRWPAPDHSS